MEEDKIVDALQIIVNQAGLMEWDVLVHIKDNKTGMIVIGDPEDLDSFEEGTLDGSFKRFAAPRLS